jgi:hypothetical protein
MTFQCPAAYLVGKGRHLLQDAVHLRHYVDAGNLDPDVLRRTQGNMKDGVPPLRDAQLPGKLYEQPNRLVGDAILGMVQVQARSCSC